MENRVAGCNLDEHAIYSVAQNPRFLLGIPIIMEMLLLIGAADFCYVFIMCQCQVPSTRYHSSLQSLSAGILFYFINE